MPTFQEFVPRFLDRHARANRQKPGGIAQKETVLRVHLVPQFGTKRLCNEDVQRLKHHFQGATHGEQRAHGAEHDAEEGRRVGRD
ncbi:MAG: hypothetical protein AB7R67_21365, partial [Vicinamibacterales bacterium]